MEKHEHHHLRPLSILKTTFTTPEASRFGGFLFPIARAPLRPEETAPVSSATRENLAD